MGEYYFLEIRIEFRVLKTPRRSSPTRFCEGFPGNILSPGPRTQRLTRDREHQWPSRPPGTGTGALSLGVNLLSREGNSQKWRMKDNKSHFWRVTFTWVVGGERANHPPTHLLATPKTRALKALGPLGSL